MESRYGTRLVVVIPFTGHDVEQLLGNIRSWKTHFPCQAEREYSQFVDVAFYFHKELWTTVGIIKKIKEGWSSPDLLENSWGQIPTDSHSAPDLNRNP